MHHASFRLTLLLLYAVSSTPCPPSHVLSPMSNVDPVSLELQVTAGILSKAYASEVLPLLYSALQKNAAGHWNATVETLATNVLRHYQEAAPALYERCGAEAAAEPAAKAAADSTRAAKWARLDSLAARSAESGAAPMSYSLPIGQATAPFKALVEAYVSGATAGGGAAGVASAFGADGRPLSVSTRLALAAAHGGAGAGR